MSRGRVRKLADNRCEVCFASTSNEANRLLGGNGMKGLHVHHIYPRQSFPKKKHKLSNLILLCQECHMMLEGRFGTRLQIINWGRAKLLRQIIDIFKFPGEVPLLAFPGNASVRPGGPKPSPGIQSSSAYCLGPINANGGTICP